MSKAALKANKPIAKLVRKLDRNTRGVAKLASATQWIEDAGEDASPLAVPMFDLIQERRNLRVELEEKLKGERN